jgi:hypothetical protein
MIVNGQYIDYDEKTIADIQTRINKSDDLPGDLKSEIEKPKDVIDNQQSSWDFTNQAFFDAEYSAERFETYAYYREMDNMEFIHRGLEIVADDATQSNPEGDVVKVYSDNEKIREILWDLFMERLDMNNELWNIVYDTAKLGDNFFEVVPDDYKNPQKIIFLRYLKPDNIERIEEEGGRLSHFEYKVDGSDDREKEKNAHFRKAIEDQQEVESVYKLQPWQVVHFKVQNNRETDPYGGSLLKAGIRTYRRLSLLEDIILVYRISRAPERRVFKINVGNMNYADAQRFVQKIKEKYRTQSFIDEQGNINKKANMLSITSDIFIPVREGGQGTEVDTLQGGEALNEIKDLDYFKNKILRTMNIPLAYLGDESDRSRGSLCLAPNTKIKLADGRNLEIKEVAKEYQEGKQNYVYSIDENNEWVIKPVSWAGITRRNTKTLKITLDNGEEVIATPDHRFMLRDGSYEEAQNLKEGTSLMPIYTKYSSKELKDRIDGYEMLLNNNTGEWEYTHRIAKKNELLVEKNNDTKKTTVHHADFNKLNNNPDNLVLMDRVSHWKLHSERTKKLWKMEEYREKMCKRGFISEEQIKSKIKELDTDKLETISNSLNVNRQTLRFIVQDFGYENWIDFVEKNFEYYKSYRDHKIITKDDLLENIFNPNEKMQDVAKRMKLGVYKIINVIKEEGYNNWFEFITLEKDLKHIFSLSNNLSIKEASEEINCSPTTLTKKMKLAGYKGWKDFRFNHKVVSVEDYDILEETYDITVDEETPNFALTAGIVIHNSQMDIKFSRFIERIQSQIIKGLNKIAALELFFQGYKKEDLSNFAIELTPPSNIKELVDLDLINQRMGLIGTIQGLEIYSNAWILRNIMKHSDREIAEINMEKQQEVEQQGGEEGGEGGGGDFGGDFGGGEIEGGPDEFGGEEGGGEEFGEEPAPEGGEEAPAPEEGEAEVASTIINMLGKDFIVENKDDFFKILKASEKYLKEEKRPRDKISMMLEHASDIINSEVKKKSKTKTPEIRKQFIINEMGGLSFSKDGTKESMTLYEGMGEEAIEKEVLLNS